MRIARMTVAALLAATILAAVSAAGAGSSDNGNLLRVVTPLYDHHARMVCTAWRFDSPARVVIPRTGAAYVADSWLVTAGHCAEAEGGLWVRTADGRLGRIEPIALARSGADVMIARAPESERPALYADLATKPPAPGEAAVAVGWTRGQLVVAVLTAGDRPEQPALYGDAANPLVMHSAISVYRSNVPIRGGMSGAPVVSMITGHVLGIIVSANAGGRAVLVVPAREIKQLADLANVPATEIDCFARPRPGAAPWGDPCGM